MSVLETLAAAHSEAQQKLQDANAGAAKARAAAADALRVGDLDAAAAAHAEARRCDEEAAEAQLWVDQVREQREEAQREADRVEQTARLSSLDESLLGLKERIEESVAGCQEAVQSAKAALRDAAESQRSFVFLMREREQVGAHLEGRPAQSVGWPRDVPTVTAFNNLMESWLFQEWLREMGVQP